MPTREFTTNHTNNTNFWYQNQKNHQYSFKKEGQIEISYNEFVPFMLLQRSFQQVLRIKKKIREKGELLEKKAELWFFRERTGAVTIAVTAGTKKRKRRIKIPISAMRQNNLLPIPKNNWVQDVLSSQFRYQKEEEIKFPAPFNCSVGISYGL